ncbi:ubiquitin carboxyl-terminal hydrolase 36-like [Lytechinus variegatus]|uniref:ubiquitin carboxyl-terminal hydrolase 36-like n=1 Tax=Lytechinus variegatus TaxID=7654 RepID=UPI001BB18F73|nr:ubiquitin carboxyl-terminal hydrolase 36-like [Lytechinus variegatus]
MTIDDTLRRDLFKSKAKSGDRERSGTKAYDIDLDKHLVSSSKQVLLKNVDFQPAQKDISFRLQNLRGKYVPLNPAKSNSQSEGSKKSQGYSHKGKMSLQEESPNRSDGIPPPKQVLCRPDRVRLDWQKCYRVGSGLINMGNTCFLNSTLQCLTYTAPLANYLLSHQHKQECRAYGFCILCDLYTHIQRAFQHPNQAIRPMNMIHKLKSIAKHMHIGRQEDAHEFLRYVIEAMQKSCLSGYDKLDRYSKETSPVHQIFGGYYRSRVTCAACQCKSDTFDPFLDISLDIKHAPSVPKALMRLIQPEILDGDNAYQCKRCNRKVPAQKRFTIHRCPNILTLCLKRFEFNRFSMGKINKEVSFSEYLNLRPYMSENKGPTVGFQLYAVLKHEGGSCNSGHYYCYVRAPNQSWYCMNDSYVSQCSLNRVLNQNAYVLFYIKKPSKPSVNGNNQVQSQQTNKQMPKTATSPSIIQKASNPHQGSIGTPIARPKPTPPRPTTPTTHAPLTPKPKIIREPEKKPQTFTPTAKHNLPQTIAPPGKRDKLSFVIKSKGVASTLQSLKHGQGSVGGEIKSNVPQDKGVVSGVHRSDSSSVSGKSPLRVKNNGDAQTKKLKPPGTMKKKEEEKSSESTKKVVTVPKVNKHSSLVPYDNDDDSSSSSDSDTNYDAVVERLSKGTVKDIGASSSNSSKDIKGDSEMKPPDAAALERDKRSALANSTNLTAIRKTDSPLKLTITTNGNAQRIMSTTPWRVTDGDQQVSPSVTSDSSNHSNQSSNSTSEWAVNDKKDKPKVEETIKKEASHVGWSVKPSPSRNGLSKVRPDNGEDRRTSSPTKTPCKIKKEVTLGNGTKNRTPFSPKEEKSFVSKREKLGIVTKQMNGKHANQDRTKPIVSENGTDVQVGSDITKEREKPNGKSFVHQEPSSTKHGVDAQNTNDKKNGTHIKKNNTSSSDDSESEQEITKNKSESEVMPKKKKKKKKKKFASDADQPATSESNGKNESKDANEKGVDVGKSEKLPESDAFRKYRGAGKSGEYRSDSDSDHSSHATFKRKNGQQTPVGQPHQRFRPPPQHFQERFCSPPDSDYDEDSPVGPHNHIPWRKRSYPSDQGYYEDRPHPPQHGHDPRNHWYGAPLGNKRKKMMNGYDDGYGKQDQRRFRQEGHYQNWDHHIQDGFPRRPGGDGPHKMSHSWDGTRRHQQGDVMDFLNKSSHKGYGPSVPNWDGGRSAIDEEVARDHANMKRRNTWNEDYDRGKVKKMRKPFHPQDQFSGHHNAFQHVQNHRNKGNFHGHRGGFNQFHHMKKSQSWHAGNRRMR